LELTPNIGLAQSRGMGGGRLNLAILVKPHPINEFGHVE